MTTTTCDVCGKEINDTNMGNGCRTTREADVVLDGEGSTTLHFEATIELKCNFNTTGVHWCDNCLDAGLAKLKVHP